MSYFETVSAQSGLNQLPNNPCKLLDFNVLSLADGQTYEGNSGNREVEALDPKDIDTNVIRCPDTVKAAEMEEAIRAARKEGRARANRGR